MATVSETRVKNLGLLCEKVVNGEVDFFDSKMLEQFDFEKAVTRFKKTKELGLTSIPGSLTPSEMMTAYNAGADLIKLFPITKASNAEF